MIIKRKTGKGGDGIFDYAINKVGAEIVKSTFSSQIPYEMSNQLDDISSRNHRLELKLEHFVFSLRPGQMIDNKTIEKITDDFFSMLGIRKNNHLYACIKHTDTEHLHWHLLVSRPEKNYSGKLLSDKFIHRRLRKVCEKLEIKYELEPKTISNAATHLKVSKNEIEMANRLNEPLVKPQLAEKIIDAISITKQQGGNFKDFLKNIEQSGEVEVSLNVNKQAKKIRGISFCLINKDGSSQSSFISGSKISRDFSVLNIQKQLSNSNTLAKKRVHKPSSQSARKKYTTTSTNKNINDVQFLSGPLGFGSSKPKPKTQQIGVDNSLKIKEIEESKFLSDCEKRAAKLLLLGKRISISIKKEDNKNKQAAKYYENQLSLAESYDRKRRSAFRI